MIKWILENIRPVLDSIDQPVTVVDIQGQFIYYNNASARMDGIDPKDAIGKYILDVNPWLSEEESTLLQCLKNGQKIVNNYQVFQGAGGISTNYLHSVTPIFEINNTLIGAIEIGRAVNEIPQQVNKQNRQEEIPQIITQNKILLQEIAKLDVFSQADVPLIIYGETGTGKELIAQRAHILSQRSARPMMNINCAAIPDTLLESTLFGTVRGAFTGAENNKGLFALANGGTIFLDEINSMHISLQSKLLRVLQDGYFMPIGSQTAEYTNVRIVAALNQSPQEAINTGMLRKDLYYRLNIGEINIPPLCERKEDITLLTQFFISKYASTFKKEVTTISDEAAKILIQHTWPGNVRELQNTIFRSLILHQGESKLEKIVLTQTHQPQMKKQLKKEVYEDGGSNLTDQLLQQEKSIISKTLQTYHDNITAAAAALGIPRTTLNSKIKKLGIM